MTIKELVDQAYSNAKEKGFHGDMMNVGEKLALIHSEVSEALEEYRRAGSNVQDLWTTADNKPEGFVVELADAVIRIADLCGALQLDLEYAVQLKMAYNRSRPHKHGRKF